MEKLISCMSILNFLIIVTMVMSDTTTPMSSPDEPTQGTPQGSSQGSSQTSPQEPWLGLFLAPMTGSTAGPTPRSTPEPIIIGPDFRMDTEHGFKGVAEGETIVEKGADNLTRCALLCKVIEGASSIYYMAGDKQCYCTSSSDDQEEAERGGNLIYAVYK